MDFAHITARRHVGTPFSEMPTSMPTSATRAGVASLCVSACLTALLVGCGGGGGSTSTATPSASPGTSTPTAVPGSPSGVSVTPADQQATISWSAVAGADSYNVYRSTAPGVQGTKVGTTATTSFVDSTAANGTTYYYQVTAHNAAGEGSAAAIAINNDLLFPNLSHKCLMQKDSKKKR